MTTIPGAAIFSRAPAMPVVQNHTGGSATSAQGEADAFWRTQTLIQWAQAKSEATFIAENLLGQQSSNYLLPVAQAALSDGGTVIDPNCDSFPTAVQLWPQSAAVTAWLAANGYQTQAPVVFLVPYNETGCQLTITDKGKVTHESADPSHPSGVDKVVVVGEIFNDPTIGPYFRVEGSSTCDRTAAVPQMCS